jgi:putative ABC transport system permease protein
VINEVSYDKHFNKADQIYRMQSEIQFGGNHSFTTYTPAPLASALAANFPEVEASTRFRERGSYLVKRFDDNIKEDHVIWADSTFFKVFDLPMIAGNAATALKEPNSIAISERMAKKYFPNENALGQTLILDNKIECMKITAVYQDIPVNSHFHFDILIAMAGLEEAQRTVWYSNNFQTYMLLRKDASIPDLDTKIKALVDKNMMPQIAELLGSDFTAEKFAAAGNKIEYKLQPLTDIHLKSSLAG